MSLVISITRLQRWDYWYSARLTILAIVFVYSTFVPLVLPLGILFSFLSYLVDRRNFEQRIYTSTWGDNGTFSRAVTQLAIIFAAIFLVSPSLFPFFQMLNLKPHEHTAVPRQSAVHARQSRLFIVGSRGFHSHVGDDLCRVCALIHSPNTALAERNLLAAQQRSVSLPF